MKLTSIDQNELLVESLSKYNQQNPDCYPHPKYPVWKKINFGQVYC